MEDKLPKQWSMNNSNKIVSIYQNHLSSLSKALLGRDRLGRLEEVAEMALWLLSDKASLVTGSYFVDDRG